jgi:hypothetical protein
MNLSPEARNVIGWIIITIPFIEFGGAFLLSGLRTRNGIIRTALQASYYRAGHAHAGVLVILAIIAQVLIDAGGFDPSLRGLLRLGFVLPPILMPLGFFLAPPLKEGEIKPSALILLVYAGALVLAASTLGLGIGLVTGSNA